MRERTEREAYTERQGERGRRRAGIGERVSAERRAVCRRRRAERLHVYFPSFTHVRTPLPGELALSLVLERTVIYEKNPGKSIIFFCLNHSEM